MSYTIYSTHTCPFCTAAQNLLSQNKLPFDVKYVDANKEILAEMLTLAPGAKTVPQIFLDEGDGFHQYIGGHDDLVKHLIESKK